MDGEATQGMSLTQVVNLVKAQRRYHSLINALVNVLGGNLVPVKVIIVDSLLNHLHFLYRI